MRCSSCVISTCTVSCHTRQLLPIAARIQTEHSACLKWYCVNSQQLTPLNRSVHNIARSRISCFGDLACCTH
jgi:hypothetical protein